MAVLMPIKAVLITTGVLVLADFVTGLMAAWKKREPITSANMRRTITKMFIFQTTVISAYLIERYMLEGALPVTKLVSAVVGITEGKSIIENAEIIYGQPIFKSVLKALSSHNDENH
jgi:phage-related holin